jgi:hypothetical protein
MNNITVIVLSVLLSLTVIVFVTIITIILIKKAVFTLIKKCFVLRTQMEMKWYPIWDVRVLVAG